MCFMYVCEGQDLLVADLARSEPFSKVLLAGKVV
jgi:hypothetical protein